MALELSKELETGYNANYWKIDKLDINTKEETSFITVNLYKDNAARLADKKEVFSRTFEWCGNDYPFIVAAMDVDNPLTIAYTKLKTLDEFAGAIDA